MRVLHHALRALVGDLRVLELRLRCGLLRPRGFQVGLGLCDLVGRQPFLESNRGFALLHLRSHAFGAEGVEGPFLAQFVRLEDGQQLVGFHDVAFGDHQLVESSGDLRADHDVIRGDDARQDQAGDRAAGCTSRRRRPRQGAGEAESLVS